MANILAMDHLEMRTLLLESLLLQGNLQAALITVKEILSQPLNEHILERLHNVASSTLKITADKILTKYTEVNKVLIT
jgi:hypothetical protein